MKSIGNFLWHFMFLGFVISICARSFARILTAIAITAPVGLGMRQLGRYYLAPFTRMLVPVDGNGIVIGSPSWVPQPSWAMLVWVPFSAVLAAMVIMQIVFACLTVMGIPLAVVAAKSLRAVFNPVGAVCLTKRRLDIAKNVHAARARAAKRRESRRMSRPAAPGHYKKR